MASSPTTEPVDRPAGSSVEVLIGISAVLILVVAMAGTFAPDLLPWANGVVNQIADKLGIDF